MRDQVPPESLMYEILRLVEEIHQVGLRLSNEEAGVFGALSLHIPVLTPAELGFVRTVSWLYVLYFEVGKVNVEFLSEKLSVFGHDADGTTVVHRGTVQQLRTYSQHNLDPSERQNRQIQEYCERWFESKCGTPIPKEDGQWHICLTELLEEALRFLKALGQCIRSIERDDSRGQILHDWEFRRKRYHAPHEFDELISKVATDMGRDKLDPVTLRKRFYNKWVKELELLQGDYDFEVEARKMIEHVLLVETIPVLPITGKDIMHEFGIPPGPKIGDLLKLARSLNESDPTSRETLIERLRENLVDSSNESEAL